ncbi:DNA polymerase delta subunit 2-like [Chelonus insularis]|uniref:DNA polymerase delta subunit 2-like n=1 Tax=Chelonus insularis TaxID=460826 RepID=UPI00158AFE3A|nr:DNA polymerase delta subunit 2-like [Chelonus insularis]
MPVIERYSDKFPLEKNNCVPSFERKAIEHKDLSVSFVPKSKDFSKQFFHVYLSRLQKLRPILAEKASKKWNNVQILKLPELENFENQQCIVIGTLFKHQMWKPSILRDLNEETQDSTNIPEKRTCYDSEKDVAYLEDEILRIKIIGDKVNISEIVTGVVCAVLGKTTSDGSFEVEDWCFPGCPLQQNELTPLPGKLLLLSSLDFATNTNTLSIELLIEWLSGMAGTVDAQENAASVVNLLIAGNSIKSAEDDIRISKGLMEARAQETAIAREISAAVTQLDKFLSQLGNDCCITLMPGQYDPTNVMVPQKPIHPLMLRESRKFENIKGVGNPWMGMIGNRFVCGSSGQPIEDILRVSGETEVTPIEWLERTLNWRQFCPTAPDTLPSHPYNEEDLLVMHECPDIYFVGNMQRFETKLFKGPEGQTVRLVCIPKFSKTSTAVLVDLNTLSVTPISFGVTQ